MPNIIEVADQIITEKLPALFLDTCILLDIIRCIKRRHKNFVAHARGLHDAATTNPKQCILVVSRLVGHEWGMNHQAQLDEAARHLTELQEQSEHFHDACGALEIAPGFDRANYAEHGVATRLHELAQRLLDCALVVESDNECSERAFHRVIYNIPPSRKGREAKDCKILEEYLAIARRLHEAQFQKKMVFCTSNTNDYCEGGALHPTLATEFAPINFRFTSNLGWGFHDVTH